MRSPGHLGKSPELEKVNDTRRKIYQRVRNMKGISWSKCGNLDHVCIPPQGPRPWWRGPKSHTHLTAPDPPGAGGSIS